MHTVLFNVLLVSCCFFFAFVSCFLFSMFVFASAFFFDNPIHRIQTDERGIKNKNKNIKKMQAL